MLEKGCRKLGEIWAGGIPIPHLSQFTDFVLNEGGIDTGDESAECLAVSVARFVETESDDDAYTAEQAHAFWMDQGFEAHALPDDAAIRQFCLGAVKRYVDAEREGLLDDVEVAG